jgi:hypothetical protein
VTPPKESYRTIPLTRGQVAIVDAADYEWLNQWKWYAEWGGYAVRTHWSKTKPQFCVRMHRAILGLESGDPRRIDHINGNRIDNRRANLRIATAQQNAHNARISSRNTSGFKGAHRDRKWWKAQIRINGKNKNLGYFASPEEAHAAYRQAAIKAFGEFARFE